MPCCNRCALPASSSAAPRCTTADYIAERDLRVGDVVEVERAGDVIPAVKRRVERVGYSPPVTMPDACPSCGGPLSRFAEEVKVYCTSATCPEQAERRVLHWVGRDYMDVDGMGPWVVGEIFENRLVRDVADLYSLGSRRRELQSVAGMGEKRVEKLLAAIEASKSQPLARLIASLGIREIGRTAGEALAERFPSMQAAGMAASSGGLSRPSPRSGRGWPSLWPRSCQERPTSG